MNDSIQNALTYSLIFMIGVLVILVIIFVILKLKERQEDNPKKDKKDKVNSKTNNVEVKKVIDTYVYDERKPLANDVAKALKDKPKFLERKKIIPRVLDKIIGFVDKFYER